MRELLETEMSEVSGGRTPLPGWIHRHRDDPYIRRWRGDQANPANGSGNWTAAASTAPSLYWRPRLRPQNGEQTLGGPFAAWMRKSSSY